MSYRRIMRRNKRQQITLIARLMAVLLVTVMLLITEFAYICITKPGSTRVLAEENEDNDPIIIPTKDGDSESDNKADPSEGSGTGEKDGSLSGDKKEEEPVDPVVKISITEPSGWHRKAAEVKFSAEDTVGTGDFVIKEAKAKIGQTGSWTDVTDSMAMELNENCVVYVEIKDTKDRIYSKNKKITCFDSTKPTLNAAVNNGSLTIDTNDEESGVKSVYVNGFEFTDLNEGTLVIRMQQFDTGYENFAVQAMDYAGNMSDTYRVRNPYYKAKDSSGKDVKVLPDSAEPTKPASAVADVTDHVKTDDAGNMLANVFGNLFSKESTDPKSEEKKKSLAEADKEEKEEKEDEPETVSGKGREYYTIEARSGKIFYLIIDRSGDEEKVHFLTDITENDLLNVTENNSSTIPQNAAANENGDPTLESALPNNNLQMIMDKPEEKELFAAEEEIPTDKVLSGDELPEDTEKESNPWLPKLIIIGIAIAVVIIFRTINNKVKERDGDYEEDEDPEDGDDEGADDDDTEDDGYSDEGNVDDSFNTPDRPDPEEYNPLFPRKEPGTVFLVSGSLWNPGVRGWKTPGN